jgi:polyvinyl alcohol dehydrogenase (cytochrome)
LVGEKSGRVHALDPDRGGEIVWSTRVGRGGMQGGIHWGIAADTQSVYAAVADHIETLRRVPGSIETRDDPEAGALVALDAATGAVRWRAQAPGGTCAGREGCYAAFSAAPAVSAGGVVLAGSLDGHLRAYSARDGAVLWDYDTAREFEAVNGIRARGGAIDGSGPILVGGRVFVNSGYGRFGQLPGNALLAFDVAP